MVVADPRATDRNKGTKPVFKGVNPVAATTTGIFAVFKICWTQPYTSTHAGMSPSERKLVDKVLGGLHHAYARAAGSMKMYLPSYTHSAPSPGHAHTVADIMLLPLRLSLGSLLPKLLGSGAFVALSLTLTVLPA
jgi:hypothetical protein